MGIRTIVLTISLVVLFGNSKMFAQDAAAPAATPASPSIKPRVFITDSQSWETHAAAGGSNGTWGGSASGGARPQTAEVIKTFEQKCPLVQINNKPDIADYVVELDHEGGKGLLQHKDKVVVFDRRNGDSVGSKSTLSVGGSVESACGFITQHWGTHSAEMIVARDRESAPPPPHASDAAAAASPAAQIANANITISSTPTDADIEIDGSYVGTTPSVIQQAPGNIVIKIQKKGFNAWERKLKVSGGDVKVNADLDATAASAS